MRKSRLSFVMGRSYTNGSLLPRLLRPRLLRHGGDEFAELIKRFPKNDLATKACDQRKSMGLNCGVSHTTAAPAKKKKQ